MLVLDESVSRLLEERLEKFDVKTKRPPKESTDREVLKLAIEKKAPVLTRDQGDFVILDNDMDHYGIIIDKYMHLRDRTLVAETIASILEKYPRLLMKNLVFLSNYYGQF